jgi:hypothetical protein
MHNPREVLCDWQYAPKHLATGLGSNAEGDLFKVVPTSGVIQPGRYGYIEIIFTPNQEKFIA